MLSDSCCVFLDAVKQAAQNLLVDVSREGQPGYGHEREAVELLCKQVVAPDATVTNLVDLINFSGLVVCAHNTSPSNPEHDSCHWEMATQACQIILGEPPVTGDSLKKIGCDFADAEKLNAQHQNTFEIPDNADLAELKDGNEVNVAVEFSGSPDDFFEGLSLIISNIGPGPVGARTITGRVHSQPDRSDLHGIEYHSVIEFEDHHIIQTAEQRYRAIDAGKRIVPTRLEEARRPEKSGNQTC